MRCIVLPSGSSGNSIYIEGSSGALLVDAGLSRKEILARLNDAGGNPDLISAILVTHEHTDHLKGVDTLARHLDVPVCATEGTLTEFLERRKTAKSPVRTQACEYHDRFRIGDFSIEAFETSHDAREPCGFSITDHDLSIGICTDTGVITAPVMDVLNRCDGVILESNHCPAMLQSGPYPEMLKRRIRSRRGHLSNNACAACIKELSSGVGKIMLAHLSETNNTPERALASAREGAGLFIDHVEITVATNPGATHPWPKKMSL
jgi:phosphoribosyl 1,2-cyclic phosphodiesterase